jgi:hypothetical protein
VSSRAGDIPVASSLTAWGAGRSLVEAVTAAAAHADDGVVQLAIGARPDPNWLAVCSSVGVEWVAHHAVPLGRTMLRPNGDPDEMVQALTALGIRRYSAHPPARRHADDAELWAWARRWHDALAHAGITFALETMYPPLDPADAGYGAGWHLDTPASVHALLDQAERAGWAAPLVVDGAHLHIGVTSGVWSHDDVDALVARCAETGACAEAHLSANDGVRDRHLPPGTLPPVDAWVRHIAEGCRPALIVDEGRRR